MRKLSNPGTRHSSKLKHMATSPKSYDNLKRLGFAGDSFNDMLNVLLNEREDSD